MDMGTIRELQAYAYAFGSVFLAVIFYSYVYYLYTSKKKGGKDFEDYAKIALNDEIDDALVEPKEPLKKRSDR